ncbi:MAG: hypothetical protein IT366_01705 [Candidatus Hydrogenedentes bacterium]|nr:hypothetical protein [Candidatus Hydrogenedentota bacterium]
MVDEPEVIRRQMQETRANLSNKLEALECQVRDDVNGIATKVTETVDTVREQIDFTKAAISNTVDSVKDTLSVVQQTERHPWMMMAGAATLGLVGGRLLNNGAPARQQFHAAPLMNNEDVSNTYTRPFIQEDNEVPDNGEAHSVFHKLAETFNPEISILKGLAIGALFGVLRDVVLRAAPSTVEQPLGTVIDGFTVRLGGQPVRGPVLRRER